MNITAKQCAVLAGNIIALLETEEFKYYYHSWEIKELFYSIYKEQVLMEIMESAIIMDDYKNLSKEIEKYPSIVEVKAYNTAKVMDDNKKKILALEIIRAIDMTLEFVKYDNIIEKLKRLQKDLLHYVMDGEEAGLFEQLKMES